MKPSIYVYLKMSKQDFEVFNVEKQSLLLSQDLHSLQTNVKIIIKPTDKWIGVKCFSLHKLL